MAIDARSFFITDMGIFHDFPFAFDKAPNLIHSRTGAQSPSLPLAWGGACCAPRRVPTRRSGCPTPVRCAPPPPPRTPPRSKRPLTWWTPLCAGTPLPNEEGTPTAAVVPVMKRKTLKELGTPTVQAEEIGESIIDLSPEELLALAEAQRVTLEVTGELDRVADQQPKKPPKRNSESIVSTMLEVCWRYWRPPTEEEKAKGDKRKRIAVKIWCECEVVAVANGSSDKEAPGSKNVLAKGALRVRWPEDVERKEKESYSWHMFQDEDWYGESNKEAHLSWRYAASELRKRAEAATESGGAQGASKRRK